MVHFNSTQLFGTCSEIANWTVAAELRRVESYDVTSASSGTAKHSGIIRSQLALAWKVFCNKLSTSPIWKLFATVAFRQLPVRRDPMTTQTAGPIPARLPIMNFLRVPVRKLSLRQCTSLICKINLSANWVPADRQSEYLAANINSHKLSGYKLHTLHTRIRHQFN